MRGEIIVRSLTANSLLVIFLICELMANSWRFQLAKYKQGIRVSYLSLLIYVVVVITLAVAAKDNLWSAIQQWLESDEIRHNTTMEGSIEVAFSPKMGATASIVKAISEAQKTILVSAYSFSSKEIAEALLKAKKRQVIIKLILDKSQMSHQYSASKFFINQGFELRIDVKHAIYHNKVMIIDDKTIVTGSFNFTKAAETKNAENVLIIRNNHSLAMLYKKNWLFHWQQCISPTEYLSKNSR
jgi:phosphatidylserine/phosphatidylglycerophosphate/cardiolipin synthase-like enzyme